jgi:hypothetical protein
VGDYFFAYYVEEVERANFAHELELFSDRLHRRPEVIVGTEITLEAVMFLVKRNHRAGIVDDGLKLLAVPNKAGILHQLIDIDLIHIGDGVGVELS